MLWILNTKKNENIKIVFRLCHGLKRARSSNNWNTLHSAQYWFFLLQASLFIRPILGRTAVNEAQISKCIKFILTYLPHTQLEQKRYSICNIFIRLNFNAILSEFIICLTHGQISYDSSEKSIISIKQGQFLRPCHEANRPNLIRELCIV